MVILQGVKGKEGAGLCETFCKSGCHKVLGKGKDELSDGVM